MTEIPTQSSNLMIQLVFSNLKHVLFGQHQGVLREG